VKQNGVTTTATPFSFLIPLCSTPVLYSPELPRFPLWFFSHLHISDSTPTADANGDFTEGSAAGGIPATLITARWLNTIQREFVSVLEAQGVALNTEDDAQLLKALRLLARGTTTTLTESTSITEAQLGLLLLDASAGARTFTLPAVNAALGVVECVLRRTDTNVNAMVIAASGADKIMLDTTAEAAGQSSTELLFAGDYLRLRSDGAGKWWCVGQAQLPGSVANGLISFSAVGVHTFTVPAVLRSGRRRAKVTVVGGGGAGAYGGGSVGGTAIKRVDLVGAVSVSVTVGAGGLYSSTAPTRGEASSFGAYCSAGGGYPGSTIGGGRRLMEGQGGGIGIGGDINLQGQFGSAAMRGADGGSSTLGGGGAGSTNDAAPAQTGHWPGGGGSGRAEFATPGSGNGNGAVGGVIVEW